MHTVIKTYKYFIACDRRCLLLLLLLTVQACDRRCLLLLLLTVQDEKLHSP